jgi:redox-sensitive bicupin YhaK (pirin superfamily)
MTAGAGIVHSEMPSRALREQGGRVHGFQVWVNLPARLKLTTPRYQEIAAAAIPNAETPDGRARVRVVAGEALGVRAVIDTHTPIVYQDWSLAPGGDATVAIAPDHQALAYVFEGSVLIGERGGGRLVADGQMALLGGGDSVRLRGAPGGGRMLLLAGVPLGEPIARYGPFVMNNEAELVAAFQDYQSGRMGEITRTAKVG